MTENVTRIPIKAGEQQLPGTAADGLRYFTPVDIYDHNVACTEGLVQVFKILQDLEGFGMTRHLRSGHYSFLHVDVKIFWLLFPMMYCYPALQVLLIFVSNSL